MSNAILFPERRPLLSRIDRILSFELDPENMAFVRLDGLDDGFLGFGRGDWFAPGFWIARLDPFDRDIVTEYVEDCVARAPRP